MLSLSTLNVQATGLPRARRLLPWLLDQDQDVWVLTETTGGPGTAHLMDGLPAAGYRVLHPASAPGDRGVALASRVGFTVRADVSAMVSLPGRVACVDLHTDPAIVLMGVYVPSSDRAPDKVAKKRAFLTSLLAAIRELDESGRSGLVVCGDYNVIGRGHQPIYRAFLPFEYELLDDLAGLGLADVHDHFSPGIQVHSWFGRTGNGYRFDYVHVAAELCRRVRVCQYVAQPRELGLSDHSAVTVTLTGIKPRSAPQQRQATYRRSAVTASASRISES